MTYTSLGGARAAEPVVWLALSEAGGAYAEAAEAIRGELQRGNASRPELLVKPWREFIDAPPGAAPRLVVAVGVGALRGLAESNLKLPMLATLVPRAAFMRIAESGGYGRALSALWLDQPAARQFELLRLALPEQRRIGILLGPESRLVEAELLRAGADRGLDVVTARVDLPEQLSGALQRTLNDADVLLALPDPQVYNSATIQNILTAAYRRRIPLAGFSPAYIKAGALLALYSTPPQVGRQAGEIVRGVLAGRPLPPPHGPRDFSIGINPDVARSLGISFDADAALRWTEQLRVKEHNP